MERNDTGLDAEAEKEQHKCRGLLGARQVRCGLVEAREVRATADVHQ